MSDSRWRAHWHAGAVIEGSDLPPSTAPVPRGPIRRWLRARPADVIDVFVYVVVLNLAVEYVPSVLTESFTLSLLTAVLLKVVLELVVVIKGRIVAGFRAAGHMAAHLAGLREAYRLRRDAMLEALAAVFGRLQGTRWSKPDGGFFIWVELPGNIDTGALFPLALEHGVAFIPGSAFVERDGPRNAMRLCFANASPAEICDGMGRLRLAVDRLL